MRMQSYPRMILCMNEEEESPLEIFLLPPASQDQQLLQPVGTRVSIILLCFCKGHGR